MLTPLTVVLDWDGDFRQSEGLALIDDVSRFLAHQRRLGEVRSATQPLGSPKPLERARIASRLGAVNDGFAQMADGAGRLEKGLAEGAVKLRAALWLEQKTGLNLIGRGTGPSATAKAPAAAAPSGTGTAAPGIGKAEDPQEAMLRELTRAAEGAGQIAEGARRARHEVSSILDDPVGRRALDRLLINAETVKAHPELLRSFGIYISPDGRRARIELAQADRVFSAAGDGPGGDACAIGSTSTSATSKGVRVRAAITRPERARRRHPRPDAVRPVPELVRRADRRLPGPAAGPPRPAGVRQPGRDDAPDLRLRAGDDAPGLRDDPGGRGDRLEGALLPVRAAGGGGGRLQRLPDGPGPPGDGGDGGSARGSSGRSGRPAA